jgi:hypothetical protein
MAADLPDLEEALALERRVLRGPAAGALDEPTAVPYCGFLIAADSYGAVHGVCRLLPHGAGGLRHGLPGAPRRGVPGTVFPASPSLVTALRYSCQRVLEAGSMAVAPGADAEAVSSALWRGIHRHMIDLDLAFVLGRERMEQPRAEGWEKGLSLLRDAFGLHPDLEEETGTAAREDWTRRDGRSAPDRDAPPLQEVLAWLPAGLREGLRRGCRLVGRGSSADYLRSGGPLEFVWVASRDMLDA